MQEGKNDHKSIYPAEPFLEDTCLHFYIYMAGGLCQVKIEIFDLCKNT